MLDMLWEKVNNLYRRVMLIVVQGVINTVDDSGGIQKVQLGLGSGYLRDNTLRMQNYGFTSNPPPGSFGVLFSAGGNISDSVLVACEDPKYRPTNLAPGESQMYDNAGKYIYISAGGILINSLNTPVVIMQATEVTVNASVSVTLNTPLVQAQGDIIDNYGRNPHTLADMRALYNAHFHGGVQSGASNTNIPDNSM